MTFIDYSGDPRSVLFHFNENHDPSTGRFTSKGLAGKIYKSASKRVDKISNDVIDSAKNAGSEMYGLEHRQKTKESIARKIDSDSQKDGISIEDAAKGIKDAVRFTTVSNEKDFVSNYEKFKKSMTKKGYSETRCKNFFQQFREGKVKHKSVQSIFETDDGYKFEIQFQTPASQRAKDLKVPLYEEVRKPGVSDKRRKEIERLMEQLAIDVPDPINIDRIKSY